MAEASNLIFELTTVKGEVLRVRSMTAREEISGLFEYQILAASDDADLVAEDFLGTPIAVCMKNGQQGNRWFHGLVAAFGFEGTGGRRSTYRITVRPALWLLTQASDLRIFQAMSVVDIVKKVLSAYAGNVVYQLNGTYAEREFCVQYRETDFNFVSRLLEEEGIFYFFRHAEGKHELIIADAPNVHATVDGYETIDFGLGGLARAARTGIDEWITRHEIQTGKVTLREFNFLDPAADLTSSPAKSGRHHAESELEIYDYPGLYRTRSAGDGRARIRLEEAESRFGRYVGNGDTAGLVAGSRFVLASHPRADQNGEYIVLSTQIELSQSPYEGGDTGDTKFRCSFSAQRYDEPLRPQRVTRKPAVAGPQTAIVVGDGGAGDIVTDEHARVKVQFHWDRIGKKKADSSCWVRVASPSAGNGWGMISVPRVGQEVVVDFLEGDPDQPLITGRVHNAQQKPPYELPANATVSTIKSRSKQGGADDFNELRFEDKAGSEYVLLHAQKDRFEFVEETLKSEVGKQEHRTVKDSRKEKVEGEYHLTVMKDAKQKVDGALGIQTGADMLLKSGGIFSLKTAQDITAQAGTAISLKSGTDLHLKIGANIGAEGELNIHLKAGINVVIEGGMQITLKAGPSSVVLGPDGVSITGPMVKINSGGAPGAGAGAQPVAPTDPAAPEAPELPQDPLAHR